MPLYVRYNSGRHISDTGRQLADLLQEYVESLPSAVQEVALVGHSMGGLVAHSAAHYGRESSHGWLNHLGHIISIAAPHDGAPLEKFGNLATTILGAIDTPGTRIPAEVIDARSAGIKDLRHGYVVEEDWRDADPDALLQDGRTHAHWVEGVRYHRVVATLTEDPAHPMGRLFGDTMVRPGSAAASNPVHTMGDEPGEVAVVGGISHVGLANHPRVYEHLRAWLRD
jgi:pimeloyl-ACP methyl ester carboxylesterase